MSAKRRTKSQIKADQIVKKELNILGEKIYRKSRRTTRVLTGALKNSQNYAVKPDTTLTMYQLDYGSEVRPAGKQSGELNALLIAVKEELPIGAEVIVKQLTQNVLSSFNKK